MGSKEEVETVEGVDILMRLWIIRSDPARTLARMVVAGDV